MRVAKARLQPAGQRLVSQQRVEMHRHLGHAHTMPVGRDGGVQVGQSLAVIEPTAFGHEAVKQRQHAVRAIREAAQGLPWIDAGLFPALIEPALGASRFIGWRKPQEGQVVPGLEVGAILVELRPSFGIDQRGRGSGMALRYCGAASRTASTKMLQPEPRRRMALLMRPLTATSSAATAESRSGPRNLALRWNEPSLFKTTPEPTSAAHGR